MLKLSKQHNKFTFRLSTIYLYAKGIANSHKITHFVLPLQNHTISE